MELNPADGDQEYVSVGSTPALKEVLRTVEEPLHIDIAPPPAIVTTGSAPVIPVNAEVCPETRVALAAVRILPPSATNLIQGLVALSKVPLNCAAAILPSVPLISVGK